MAFTFLGAFVLKENLHISESTVLASAQAFVFLTLVLSSNVGVSAWKSCSVGSQALIRRCCTRERRSVTDL